MQWNQNQYNKGKFTKIYVFVFVSLFILIKWTLDLDLLSRENRLQPLVTALIGLQG